MVSQKLYVASLQESFARIGARDYFTGPSSGIMIIFRGFDELLPWIESLPQVIH